MPPKLISAICILLIVLKSAFTALLAYGAGVGEALATGALLFDLIICYQIWKQKRWAHYLMAARLAIGLLFVAFWSVGRGFYILGAVDAILTGAILIMLLGRPSRSRLYSSLGLATLLLLGIGGIATIKLYETRRLERAIEAAPYVSRFKSGHDYELSLKQLPWKMLQQETAQELLGQEIAVADLILVRSDGGAFGLFFPLALPNIPFSAAFAQRLEGELKRTLLSNLRNWKEYLEEDGFFLTAQGPDEEVPLSYVVLYKHLEGLGVYAILWSPRENSRQLLSDARAIYSHLSAPPLKSRLPKFSPSQIYQTNSPAVVAILIQDAEGKGIARGSGFNLAPEGLIVTSRHLLTEGEKLEVAFHDMKNFSDVKVVAIGGKGLDLALLAVEGEKLPTVQRLKSVGVSPGDGVVVIGNPKGLNNSVSEGIVSAVREGEAVRYYQISAPMSSGSSGGPVFNEFGEVIGVATSVVLDAQNINFSISIDELRNLKLLPSPMSLEELLKAVKHE